MSKELEALKKNIKNCLDLVKLVSPKNFPEYKEELIRSFLQNPKALRDLIHNSDGLITIVKAFPEHADELSRIVLQDQETLKKLTARASTVKRLHQEFPEYIGEDGQIVTAVEVKMAESLTSFRVTDLHSSKIKQKKRPHPFLEEKRSAVDSTSSFFSSHHNASSLRASISSSNNESNEPLFSKHKWKTVIAGLLLMGLSGFGGAVVAGVVFGTIVKGTLATALVSSGVGIVGMIGLITCALVVYISIGRIQPVIRD